MLDHRRLAETGSFPMKKLLAVRLVLAASAVCALCPLLQWHGLRSLQIGENSMTVNPQAAGSYLYEAAAGLKCSPVPWRLLAEYHHACGDFQEAVRCNRELVRRSPHRSSSYCRLVRSMLLAGQDGEISGLLDQAQLWYPGNPQIYYLRALQQIAPELRMMGVIQSQKLLMNLIALKSKIKEDQAGITILLRPAERQNFYLGDEILRKMNGCGIRFADQRPVYFKEGD